ncbi:MAG: Rossmann-like and DUF2520 domain-containing protein [Lachnospiraceae bacterium]
MEPRIGFIGAGKVGFSLGKFFSTAGFTVTGYYSRHLESANEAAEFTDTKSFTELEDIVKESDALFLTVPDGEILFVYERIKGMLETGKQICHCSGALSSAEAFPQIDKTGAYGYSIHPLFPISNKLTSYRELPDAFFCLEGNGPHLTEWKQRLEKLGPNVQIIDSSCKVKYHAACAISSNLVCALVQESMELLTQCGFSEELALQALTPLIKSNMNHILSEGPKQALTGPMERGDVKTVEKHLQCFATEAERAMYFSISRKLMQLAKMKNAERDYHGMEGMLERYADSGAFSK